MEAAMMGMIGGSLCFLLCFLVALLRDERRAWTGYLLQVERDLERNVEGALKADQKKDRQRALAQAA